MMPENMPQPDSDIKNNPATPHNADNSSGALHMPEAFAGGSNSISGQNTVPASQDAPAQENMPDNENSANAPDGQPISGDCAGEKQELPADGGNLPPDEPPAPGAANDGEKPEAEKTMGLLDHLSELRQRLTKSALAAVCGFAVCWIFVDPLFNILMAPLLAVLPDGSHAQYTTLPEAFFTRMRVAFVAGLFLTSPIIFYQIWAFVAPGLYDEEKRHILPIAFLSAIFFIAGGLFCYFIVFPFAFNFFISYSTPEMVITPKVSDYLSFCLKLIFAFGLIFEMPIFTFFLARLGIVTAGMMKRARKYAIVGIFILAAILTPPDVVSQILMACPMLLLYEASIGVAALFGKNRKKTEHMENQDNDA